MRPIEADTEALGHTGDLRWVPQESEAHLVDETAGALRPRGRLGVTAHRLYAHGHSSGEEHRCELIGDRSGQREETDAPVTGSQRDGRALPSVATSARLRFLGLLDETGDRKSTRLNSRH